MWQQYVIPATIEEALDLLAAHPGAARAVAGGTDLVIEIDRGVRHLDTLVDITRIPGLGEIAFGDDGRIHIGALVTHNQLVGSALCVARALPLAQACIEVGAPQIRNRGTIAGNLITASPANDTITPLLALDADLTLRSARGSRVVALRDFYTGVRRTVMAPDELLTEIAFAPLADGERGVFLKLGLRRAQAIAVVNAAVTARFATDSSVTSARIALGSVAPTIVRAAEAEEYLAGRALDDATIAEAAALAERTARPIDDVRGPASYRKGMVASLVSRALHLLAAGEERRGWPERPVLLRTEDQEPRHGDKETGDRRPETRRPETGDRRPETGDKETDCKLQVVTCDLRPESVIQMTINGVSTELRGAHDLTLLDALRDVAELTGTKKGCAEGECGSCTVWLNGAAIMSCLTPAGQAQGAAVVTVEGLVRDGKLHPVQQAFIERGAVQCGYCTPGLIMAAAKLLEERPRPTVEEAQQAISGNLCRCTGYTKVIEAIMSAHLEAG
jgi:xanthine dehydrogenase iron-sulfur cluster and FAD-binding subunit A